METTGVQMKCSMQEDESVPLFFFHTFIFSAQLPFSRCSESPSETSLWLLSLAYSAG